MCKVLSFVLELHVETLITEPISMDLGFGQVVKVNLLNLFGIYPAEQCRNLATQVRLPSETRIIAKPEGDSVPSVLTARHIEVRSWPLSLRSCAWVTHPWNHRDRCRRRSAARRTTAIGASRATVCRVLANRATLTGSQSSPVA